MFYKDEIFPDTANSRTGDFYAYILCLCCVYVIPVMCHQNGVIPAHEYSCRTASRDTSVFSVACLIQSERNER